MMVMEEWENPPSTAVLTPNPNSPLSFPPFPPPLNKMHFPMSS